MLLGFLGALPLWALHPERSVFQYNCQTWRRQSGLTANGINAIAQTREGYIWLGTSAGLVRFDGSEFKPLEMSQPPQMRSTLVRSLCRAEAGGLWFGLEHGSFGFCDEKQLSFRGRPDWGGLDLNVHCLIEPRPGELWIAAETQLARLSQDGRFTPIQTRPLNGDWRDDVLALYKDAQGRIWCGTERAGLFCFQNGAMTRFPDPALANLTIRALTQDKRGRLWVGTETGLICYGTNLQRKPLPSPWYATRTLLTDRDGCVWAGTAGGGLYRFRRDEPPSVLRQIDGLADDFVNCLAEDREGNLWVGTRDGLSQLSDVKIPTFDKHDGLTADINVAICASRKGGLWIATGSGFTYFDGTARHYSSESGLRNPYLNAIYEASNDELYVINGSREVQVFSHTSLVATYTNAAWPTAITEDAHGVVVAVGDCLYRAGTNYFRPYPFANGRPPPVHWIFNLAPSHDGSFWLAAGDAICRVKEDRFQLWGHTEGLPQFKVLWICEDADGVAWAGLDAGLVRIKAGKLSVVNRSQGLFDDILYSIIPDDHGSLWFDSSRGFFRVNRQALNDFIDGKTASFQCTDFNGLDAVKSDEKFQQKPSGCKTLDGRIWFPTARGLAMIDPTNLTFNPVPPPVHIDSVRANGREVDLSRPVVVPPGAGELEFHYAGLSYIAPLKIHYRYRLIGYDSNWVEAGNRRSAFFTNLRPGQYRFQVQACNEEQDWNPAGASIAVELQPHFYETLWFFAATVLLGVGGVAGFSLWRLKRLTWKQRQLQAARELLEAKVAERTRELTKEIEERKRMQEEIENIHGQLLETSRRAGQADVATGVLHNVGNVLNSVNISAELMRQRLRKTGLPNLAKAAELLQEHQANLTQFLTRDDRGQRLPQFLEQLAQRLAREQHELIHELDGLSKNVEHIKEIVAMQQTYARVTGVLETVPMAELVDVALRMHAATLARHGVKIVRHFAEVPEVTIDKHKVLQIFINLLSNAMHACDEARPQGKRVVIRLTPAAPNRVRVEVEDNGVGIAPENLTRVFSHGFTTRKNGHGFGLHSAALAAMEMGGTLLARSEGLGKGAVFVLEVPLQPLRKNSPGPAAPSHSSS